MSKQSAQGNILEIKQAKHIKNCFCLRCYCAFVYSFVYIWLFLAQICTLNSPLFSLFCSMMLYCSCDVISCGMGGCCCMGGGFQPRLSVRSGGGGGGSAPTPTPTPIPGPGPGPQPPAPLLMMLDWMSWVVA